VQDTHASLETDNPPSPLDIHTDIHNNNDTTAPPTIPAPPMITEHEQEPEQELPYWNTLQIVRQSTGKGKIRYLIRWEDPTAPDSWSDAADVNDELKRVFYLTHTKTGSRRLHPLKNTEHPILTSAVNSLNENAKYRENNNEHSLMNEATFSRIRQTPTTQNTRTKALQTLQRTHEEKNTKMTYFTRWNNFKVADIKHDEDDVTNVLRNLFL